MSEAIPPLPNTPSWRGSKLKAQGQHFRLHLRFTYYLCVASPHTRRSVHGPSPVPTHLISENNLYFRFSVTQCDFIGPAYGPRNHYHL